MNTVQLLMTILRAEVLGSEELESITPALTEEALEKLYKLAKAHDLAHIVASALIKLGKLGKDELSKKWNKQFLLAVYRRQSQNEVLEQLCALFEENRIEHIPLKGSVLCHYYPEPWMRTGCDVDVLIHPEDADRAIKVLCEAGFTKEHTMPDHDYSLFAPNGVHLELHFVLTASAYLSDATKILKAVWEYTVPVENKIYQKLLKNEMFVFYHTAHMAKHFVHGGCGIRTFLDLWILNTHLTVDEKALYDLLNFASLANFYESARETAATWFQKEPYSEKTRQIERFVLTGGSYGSTQTNEAMKQARGIGKLQATVKAIFLPRKNMEFLFPNAKKYPILLPYYHVKRWFGIFRKDKRQKIKRMTQIQKDVTPTATQSAADLLVSLGLDKQIT